MQHSNKYIFIYSIVMVVLVAVLLTIVAVQLKPAQEENIRIEKMQNILSSVNIPVAGIPKKEVQNTYNKYIKKAFAINTKGDIVDSVTDDVFAIDMANEIKKPEAEQKLPLFLAVLDGNDSAYVVPLRGKGLWGPIWGYISFKTDLNTVYGCIYDHKSETPGLGAEISMDWFQKRFFGKTIYKNDDFVSIGVMKVGQPKDEEHDIDAISGGTITSKGVEKMLKDNLTKYQSYFKKNR